MPREKLEADVLIIGAGPAGLACALHLATLVERHKQTGKSPPLSPENICVLEKGREAGAHQLSGAIMDPRALRELVPGFEKTAPLDSPVTSEAVCYLTEKNSWKLPITSPPLGNHGNYVVSLNRLVKWMAELVEAKGVNLFTEFAAQELIYCADEGAEDNGVAGVVTGSKGVDKSGKPKNNFTPGCELRAKVTVLAEGARGSLAKDLVSRLKLEGLNPQVYGIGIKELWSVPPGRIAAGAVTHTLGWPLTSQMYGGGWMYGLRGNRVSLGMVVGLEYAHPLFDPHEAFQKFKTHRMVRRILDGGSLVRYGAKTVPYGGWYSMPRCYAKGALIIGDSASLLNSRRLKGIHTAIKSGMLAAETIYEALVAGDTSARKLSAYQEKIERSWLKRELWPVRNFHQAFEGGLWKGLAHAGIQYVTGGRGLVDPMRAEAGHTRYAKSSGDGALANPPPRFQGDGKLTFDRLADLYHSGTRHEEDQPCHLVVIEPDICGGRCAREYGNPCQYFCPAAVYEIAMEKGERKLKISAANCVHCKTCDIADPYQIIQWVPPEGGGGPNYEGM